MTNRLSTIAEPTFSKSQFIRGKQCEKSLWLFRFGEEKRPEADAFTQALLDTGHDIGEMAKAYFGGGVEVVAAPRENKEAALATQRYIDDGHEVIFEATAVHPVEGTYSRIDVLRKVEGTDTWDLIEVKSTSHVKDYHVDDLSFQYHVFHNAGFRIRRCFMMVINTDYVRSGPVDPKGLLRLEDISDRVFAKQPEIEYVAGQLGYVLERKTAPEAAIGARCTEPFDCDYKATCWKDVPPFSVYNVFNKAMADEIVKRHGTYDLSKLPADALPKDKKRIDVESFLSGESHFEPAALQRFLKKLVYPLHFLDYETFMSAIPAFDGTRPFQQIPFQFSDHVLDQPDGALQHRQYLHKNRTDPRAGFVKNLIEACDQKGTVIVYNRAFESARNIELAKMFPEHAAALKAINARMVDLLDPFKNRWAYSPKQNGSASIKAVLPAFTELSYKDMDVDNGSKAAMMYQMFMAGKLTPAETEALWAGLEVYCGQDTFAMKRLLDVLKACAVKAPSCKP